MNDHESPLDVLHRLCVASRREEFASPSPSKPFVVRRPCPICHASIRRGARDSFQCDFCPLISHLDCLQRSSPGSTCPNHHFERISTRRVRIAQQRPSNEPVRFRQDFRRRSANSTRPISDIPSAIQQAYASGEEILQHVAKEKFYALDVDLRHAALIHLDSQRVISLRKRVVWLGGGSPSLDIDLHRLPSSSNNGRCSAISERHACLYFDKKTNRFELLNYSEFGTIVDGLRYGFDDTPLDSTCTCQENERKAWNGAASVDQGTRIQIGCHRFLFYR